MIDTLKEIERDKLPALLQDPMAWKTLLIDYYPPTVRRLWTTVGDYRLYLHEIFPCKQEEALYHPHPWSSAMHILPMGSGIYEMGVSYSDENENMSQDRDTLAHHLKEVVRLEMRGDIYYEMTNKNGWHYVHPITWPVYTVMLTSKPWDDRTVIKSPEPLKEFDNETKLDIMRKFKLVYDKMQTTRR